MFNNQYNPYGYTTHQNAAPSYTVQPTTNKLYVTSLEDALQRYASPNSTMIYVLQDESMLFEVFTDLQGKKIPKAKKLVDFAPEAENGYVTRAEFDELRNKLEALISKGDNV
jgi:hypothetical protein